VIIRLAVDQLPEVTFTPNAQMKRLAALQAVDLAGTWQDSNSPFPVRSKGLLEKNQ
jgi:hypothetical protein